MNKRKILKISLYVLGSILFIMACLFGYYYYQFYYSLIPANSKFQHSAHYINPSDALLNDGFLVCNEDRIYQYYNTQDLPYPQGKNGFRDYINSNYENRNYSDSGYLNIRFIINCEGEAGRFIIHENDLNLEPIFFNEDLKNQLFKLTTEIKQWNPIFLYKGNRDSYMYVSYRIEHGEITEIIP